MSSLKKEAALLGSQGTSCMNKISRVTKRGILRVIDKRRRQKSKKEIREEMLIFLGQWIDF
jgi:hypothetical protein